MKNLISMLPFLEAEELNELILKIKENNGEYKGLRLEPLLPYLNDVVIDNLFIEKLNNNEEPVSMAPFVSDEAMNELLKLFLDNQINIKIQKFIPFFNNDQITMLFEKVKIEEYNGLKIEHLLPFLNDDNIDGLVEVRLSQNLRISSILPFMSDEAKGKLVDSYISGNNNININELMPFLTKEQIKKVFNYELEKE